ncbi:hypothetical protein AKO1_014764 [Acrasis kona]|uniref:Uncharacterized protein n=1 Tax=Acrasis kona TaxID=1008807 RepID=A0AAW2Z0W3_9EUKA
MSQPFNFKNLLICFETQISEQDAAEYRYITSNFFGRVEFDFENTEKHAREASLVFICGDIQEILKHKAIQTNIEKIRIIGQLSHNFDSTSHKSVSNGQIPINIHGVGLYYRKYFDGDDSDYFEQIKNAHQFQLLTESTKADVSLRKGIYLSKVDKDESNDAIHFHLLRCSTNLHGPTDCFRSIDDKVVNAVNEGATPFFNHPAKLNHVLAQIYDNSTTINGVKSKEKKATIKRHSDKTKDMPDNGLIAFTTFYQKKLIPNSEMNSNKSENHSPFDLLYKNTTSVLTKLRFVLKGSVQERAGLVEKFDLLLYPNSVFIIPLYTNRIYTHEIVPSSLPVDIIPTRLGYVIRCSNTEAIFKDQKTFLKQEASLVELRKPTPQDLEELRCKYREENIYHRVVEYGNVHFSMNDGDYQQPIL